MDQKCMTGWDISARELKLSNELRSMVARLLPVNHINQEVLQTYKAITDKIDPFEHDVESVGSSQKCPGAHFSNRWGPCILAIPPVMVCQQEIDAIKARSVGAAQGTDEWLSERMNYLTASVIATALGIKGPAARTKLLEEKVSRKSSFVGGPATHWGNLFEDVVIMIYEQNRDVKVYDLGLIQHERCHFLAASSDGLSSDGINLEIKCPPSRTIDGKIPIQYWNQMQLQMSVLKVPLTHFIECRFEQWEYRDPELRRFQKRKHPHQFGWFDEWVHPETGALSYSYGMVDKVKASKGMANLQAKAKPIWRWPVDKPPIPPSEEVVWLRRCGWSLEQMLVQDIEIDVDWIAYVTPVLKTFWEEVIYYRKHPHKLLLSAKKSKNRLKIKRS